MTIVLLAADALTCLAVGWLAGRAVVRRRRRGGTLPREIFEGFREKTRA